MNNKEIFNELLKIKTPINIEKFLKLSLYSKNGYYKKANVIGRRGDFITAPEISQLFGDIIGLFIINYWKENINKSFNLIELGPGLGTLLIDILRVTHTFRIFQKNINLELIESNINLIIEQRKNLFSNGVDINKILWSENFNPRNKKPVIIIANEFLDCLPIRQFYLKKNMWHEKMIELNKNSKIIKLKDIEVKNLETLNKIKKYDPIDILEISKTREEYFFKICKHINNVGGMMIIIDYGYFKKPENFTLQSIYNNKKSNILDNIGNQDISSLVDFKILISLARKSQLKINSFSSQRNFFLDHGINERAKKNLSKSNEKDKYMIKSGLDRIINNKHMGSLFKVLVLSKLK